MVRVCTGPGPDNCEFPVLREAHQPSCRVHLFASTPLVLTFGLTSFFDRSARQSPSLAPILICRCFRRGDRCTTHND
jgi:hypothetical protein